VTHGGVEGRPRSVTLAVRLLSIALLLGVAILGFGWRVPVVALSTFLVVGWLIFSAARRHNWARWALALLTIVAFAMTWSLVRFQLTYGIVVPLATVAQVTLEAVGFYLLFRPAAARWYGH
jgi:hypothetical protein